MLDLLGRDCRESGSGCKPIGGRAKGVNCNTIPFLSIVLTIVGEQSARAPTMPSTAHKCRRIKNDPNGERLSSKTGRHRVEEYANGITRDLGMFRKRTALNAKQGMGISVHCDKHCDRSAVTYHRTQALDTSYLCCTWSFELAAARHNLSTTLTLYEAAISS